MGAQTSKTLNYLSSPVTVPYFSLFMGIWVYLRHYLNILIIGSVILPWGAFSNVGSFTLNWETQQYKCWISQWITFALLVSLQALNMFWLFFVLRIAYNVAAAKVVADVRSDDEGDSDGADETGKGDVSESDLSRQVSAVEAASAIEKIEPRKEEVVNRLANGNGNGHINQNGGMGLGLGIETKANLDARKGSLKEGSDEDEEEGKESAYVQVEGKKER